MNYEELVESQKYIGDMSKEELFTYCNGLLGEIWDFEKEIERLNNIINSLEETLNKLIKEQLEQYHKRKENWEERRNVSNTWLTSRDCYYSVLKYLKELKGVDKE